MRDYVAEVRVLDETIKALEATRAAALDAYAAACCPIKVGDVVPAEGYSHRGKLVRVTRASAVKVWTGGYEFRVAGIVLKKDGTDSAHTTDWRVK